MRTDVHCGHSRSKIICNNTITIWRKFFSVLELFFFAVLFGRLNKCGLLVKSIYCVEHNRQLPLCSISCESCGGGENGNAPIHLFTYRIYDTDIDVFPQFSNIEAFICTCILYLIWELQSNEEIHAPKIMETRTCESRRIWKEFVWLILPSLLAVCFAPSNNTFGMCWENCFLSKKTRVLLNLFNYHKVAGLLSPFN